MSAREIWGRDFKTNSLSIFFWAWVLHHLFLFIFLVNKIIFASFSFESFLFEGGKKTKREMLKRKERKPYMALEAHNQERISILTFFFNCRKGLEVMCSLHTHTYKYVCICIEKEHHLESFSYREKWPYENDSQDKFHENSTVSHATIWCPKLSIRCTWWRLVTHP